MMMWHPDAINAVPFIGPTVTAFVDVNDEREYTKDDSAFVSCDEPGCDELWDVVGPHSLPEKDDYLRTQGWSAVPAPDGTIEHKCLAHA